MKKIPVLKTISDAYAFTFAQLGTIIGLIWIPFVILAVGTYFTWAHYISSLMAALRTGNLANAGGAALLLLFWTITGLLLQSIALVGVTQQALGIRHGIAMARFTIGPMEIRVFGGLLSLVALLLLFMIVAAGAGAFAYTGSVSLLRSTLQADAISSVVKLLLDGALFYAVMRLGFLLVPAGVAEGRVSLARSWALTQGNFWRIVGIAAGVLLPVLILSGIAEWLILGTKDFGSDPIPGAAAHAPDPALVLKQLDIISSHLPELVGLSLLVAPFLLGLLLSAQSFSYLAARPDGGKYTEQIATNS